MTSASHRARMSAPRDDEAVAVAAEDEAGLVLRCDVEALDALSACDRQGFLEIDAGSVMLGVEKVGALRDYLDRWLRRHGVRHVSEDLSDDAVSADRLEAKTESHAHAAVDQGERADVEAITGCDVCPSAEVLESMPPKVVCTRLGRFVAHNCVPNFRPLACPLTHGQQHAPRNETAPVAPNGKAATECP